MRRGVWSLIAFTTVLFWLVPSAAHAADELDLSWDGQTWSEQLSEPMFDPAVRWVPGDMEAKAFYVRNQAESGADLTIAVATRDHDDLLRYEDIKLSARVGSGDWVNLKRTEQNFRLNNDALPAGEARKVEVRAKFDSASPNRSQDKELTLKFRVTLSDAQASTEDPDDGDAEPTDPEPSSPEPSDPGANGPGTSGPAGPGNIGAESTGPLPQTGAPALGWLILAAGTAIGVGMALLEMRKREETEHERSH